jgi:DNA-binding phage protein
MRESVLMSTRLIIARTTLANLKPMPKETSSNQSILVELAKLIDDACNRGSTVNDIAIRAGLSRDLVSRLRNRTYRSAPSLANIEAVCHALGYRLWLKSNTIDLVSPDEIK